MLVMKHLRENIRKNLRLVTDHVADCVAQDMTDVNRYAEDFYCGLLNTAFGYRLRNLNREKKNHAAIDLADEENGIAVQVTSTTNRAKVTKTLKKFFDGKMDAEFHRLILLVIGKEDDFSKPFQTEREFDFDPARDIWDTPTLLGKLENIENIDTLKAVDAYLQKHLNIPQTGPKPIHLPVNTSLSGKFVGRERELQQMAEALKKGVKPLVIWGLGGMGKTELVSHFGRAYRDGDVYMALFREDLRQTVADSIAPGIPELKDLKLSPEERYDFVMERLRRCPAGDILIIDNADIPGGSFMDIKKDSVYRELCGLPMHLVFTTRMQDRDGIELRTMDNAELYKIFRRHGVDLTEKEMDALIVAVNAHTMTVDLMARTLDESWEEVTPEMILEAMASSTLPEADYPEVYNDRDPEQRQIYAHLRSLFNLSNIPEDGKQALRCATLLPPGGMDPALFLRGLPEGPAKAIKLLEKQGWVQRANHLLTIHPVVRLVCRTELRPTEETCGAFVDGVWGWYDLKKYDHVRFSQMAELFVNASDVLGDPDGWYIGQAGYIWLHLSEFAQALKCNLQALELRKRNRLNPMGLAIGCDNVGVAYGKLGDKNKALEYQMKALFIFEMILPPMHPDLAASYNNVGLTCGALGDHVSALEYQLKALAIRERVLPPTHPDLSTSYNNVGFSYNALGKYTEALEYQLKALKIRKKVLPQFHPDLAQSYSNLACNCYMMGEYETALDYARRAVEITAHSLPEEHPDRMACRKSLEQMEREARKRRGEK